MAKIESNPIRKSPPNKYSFGMIVSLLTATVKPMGLFAGGLYLFGFGMFGLNRFGLVDALIPYERIGCLILGSSFLAWFVVSLAQLWRMLRS